MSESLVKRNFECKIREGKQLIAVLSAINVTANQAYKGFLKEAKRKNGEITDFIELQK